MRRLVLLLLVSLTGTFGVGCDGPKQDAPDFSPAAPGSPVPLVKIPPSETGTGQPMYVPLDRPPSPAGK
jgi:hypothetical protein